MAIKDAAPLADARPDADVPGAIRRDQWGRPLITGPDGTTRAYTRASSFGEALENSFGVNQWKLGRVALGIARRPDLVLRAAAVPLPCGSSKERHGCKPPCADSKDGKRELKEIHQAALDAAGTDSKANLGTALHALTESIDHGLELGDQGPYEPILTRYRGLMEPYRVHCTEIFTVCERWHTAGTFDSLISPLGFLVAPDGTVFGPDDALVVDKKTSGTSDFFGAKFSVQTTTYAHGTPVDKETGVVAGWGEHPTPSQAWALILHLPSHPDLVDAAGWYWVNLTRGAQLADLAGQVRGVQKERNLIVPATREVTAEHPTDARRATCVVKIGGAQTVLALKMVRRTYASIWDDELRALARARADVIEGAAVGAAV